MESRKIKEALWDTDSAGGGSNTEKTCFPDAGMSRLSELLSFPLWSRAPKDARILG